MLHASVLVAASILGSALANGQTIALAPSDDPAIAKFATVRMFD